MLGVRARNLCLNNSWHRTCGRCHNWVGIPGRPPVMWSLVDQQDERKKPKFSSFQFSIFNVRLKAFNVHFYTSCIPKGILDLLLAPYLNSEKCFFSLLQQIVFQKIASISEMGQFFRSNQFKKDEKIFPWLAYFFLQIIHLYNCSYYISHSYCPLCVYSFVKCPPETWGAFFKTFWTLVVSCK